MLAPGSVEGNTNSSTDVKRISCAKYWVFTWNNYVGSKVIEFEDNLKICSKYIFGEEIAPNTGTPHLQGYVEFYSKCRPSEKYNYLKIHWEKRRGNKEQNINYCSKGGKVHTNMVLKKPVLDPLEGKILYNWQKRIIDLISAPPDNRKIYWFWEETGNVGKSSFAKHLVLTRSALLVSGKGADIKYCIASELDKRDIEIIIYDIPRQSLGHINFAALEEVKNGLFFSSKYESKNIIYNIPHLIIFANQPPSPVDLFYLSKDRWIIEEIK